MTETLTWSLHGCALFCDTPLIRDSQHEASEAIEKAIAERRRKLLVTMAMGIGETLTAVNEVYRLVNPASLAGPVPCRPQTLAAQTVRASRTSSPSGVRMTAGP